MNQKETDQISIKVESKNLTTDIEFFIEYGFKLATIFPADKPVKATLTGYGILIQLSTNSKTFEVSDSDKKYATLSNQDIIVTKYREKDDWHVGRAGMLYRDLIPNRLGGSIIASHIKIPVGGPVPDMVHYHSIDFQLIYCYNGWVKVVYEDQGEPFVLEAGDCVTQPPEIRHRVLEASDNLQVIEIGLPAEHMTSFDHELELPTKFFNPNREFAGQTFCHHIRKNANWNTAAGNGFETMQTEIITASNNMADVTILKPIQNNTSIQKISSEAGLQFYFVLQGLLKLGSTDINSETLNAGDTFVIPAGISCELSEYSGDLELLKVVNKFKAD